MAWAIGADTDDENAYASVALSPAPGASYLELRGATPLQRFGTGRYRVRLDPPVLGHSDEWRTVEPVGDTPAVIVLFSAPLDPTIAYVVTLEARNVGWHWANAWFLAEMGVQPLPPWVGRWGRVRRVLDKVTAKMGIILAVVVASAVSVRAQRGADSRPSYWALWSRAGAWSRSAKRMASASHCSLTTLIRAQEVLLL